jgi:amino-acid N-acetyltransferase
MEALALRRGHRKVFVLTTRTAQWFQERGYHQGNIADLPPKRQALYNQARNSRVFVKSLA